ncbi:MAG: hypothetical protein ABI977_06930 [Acidobacteriota bacterium]
MWTEEKQRQLDALREKEFAGMLTAVEQQQLELLFAQMDREEAERLLPAMELMEQEHRQDEAEIARLQRKKALLVTLAAQEEQLLQRAKTVLQEVQSEKPRLRAEYELALAELSRAA